MAVQTQTMPDVGQLNDVRRFTIEEYYKIAETGIFDNERVELINGKIITMAAMNTPHIGMVTRLIRLLNTTDFAEQYTLLSQVPMRIETYNEPEPDIMMAKFREDDYLNVYPTPDVMHLLIEVADTTLARDREEKKRNYASSNIPEYWIVNLPDRQIEVFKEPKGDDYNFKRIIQSGAVTCKAIGFTVVVEDLFRHLR